MSGREALIARAAAALAEAFGARARWGAAAPGRVNLIGEHTDYNLGFVMPAAIDRWCAAAAAPASGGVSRLLTVDLDERLEVSVCSAAERGPGASHAWPSWARYVIGALVERAAGLGEGPLPEMDIAIVSSVPVGAGLSSSAAVETACACLAERALGAAEDGEVFLLARARDCQRAEHRWAGVPCGLMDQLASSCGRAGHALLIDCRGDTVRPVPLPEAAEARVLVVHSGVRHELAAGEYGRRRAACERAASKLGVPSLREVAALPGAEAGLDEEEARCVRHVASENARVLAAAGAMRSGDLARLGLLMVESHASLRDDYRVSCEELDAIVELAVATDGVLGARMTGGGFGGCAVVLATPEGAERLAASLPGAYRARCARRARVWPVRAVDGAAPADL
jgi:galactokinase